MNTAQNESYKNTKNQTPRIPRIIFICSALVLSGGAMTTTGGIKIITFLQNIPQHENLTASQIVNGLILPHIMLLCGMAFLTWGFILLIRQSIIQSRIKHNDKPAI